MQYREWLMEWLECYVKPSSKQKTYIRYSEIVSQHIIRSLGDYEMSELTPLILQRFTTELLQSGNLKTGKGLSANSVNGIITVIQNSLKVAYAIGQISEYTADKIKRPKAREKQVTCFTPTEQKQIEQAVLNGKKAKMFGVVLCLYTGLRIGELLALEWSDIDFQKGIISVSKSCHDGKDENGKFARITDTPKTETSEREIPFPKQLIPYLRNLKKDSKSVYVVASDSDKLISVRAYQRSFELFLKRSVVTISNNAFSGCSSLKSITIGRGVTTIIQGAFYHCYNLSNAKFLVTTGWRKKDQYGKWSDMEESYMADPAQIAHMLYQSTWYNILQRTE